MISSDNFFPVLIIVIDEAPDISPIRSFFG
jgi:hypothetical protein